MQNGSLLTVRMLTEADELGLGLSQSIEPHCGRAVSLGEVEAKADLLSSKEHFITPITELDQLTRETLEEVVWPYPANAPIRKQDQWQVETELSPISIPAKSLSKLDRARVGNQRFLIIYFNSEIPKC